MGACSSPSPSTRVAREQHRQLWREKEPNPPKSARPTHPAKSGPRGHLLFLLELEQARLVLVGFLEHLLLQPVDHLVLVISEGLELELDAERLLFPGRGLRVSA